MKRPAIIARLPFVAWGRGYRPPAGALLQHRLPTQTHRSPLPIEADEGRQASLYLHAGAGRHAGFLRRGAGRGLLAGDHQPQIARILLAFAQNSRPQFWLDLLTKGRPLASGTRSTSRCRTSARW